jgi:Fe-S protein assembly co-chaperone HscB
MNALRLKNKVYPMSVVLSKYARYHKMARQGSSHQMAFELENRLALPVECKIKPRCDKSCLVPFGKVGHPCQSFSTYHSKKWDKPDCCEYRCQKCNTPCSDKYKFFCKNCAYLKDSKMLTQWCFFQIFKVEEDYKVDKKLIEERFRNLQLIFHPDKFESAGEPDLTETSTEYSSFINNAYTTLWDDLARAKYLLNKRGIKTVGESESITDFELLEQVMETRDSIDQATCAEELMMHRQVAEYERKGCIK